MPHSSGGGSSGGGFHSGSSGSSGPRFSSRPFAGSRCYVYYSGRRHKPHLIYTDGDPKKAKWANLLSTGLTALFTFIPWVIVAFVGNHNPVKLDANYDTSTLIYDKYDILTAEDETAIKNKFDEFFTVSGITPALICVEANDWNTALDLEDYAYAQYISRFHDERHWLFVYSTYRSDSTRFSYEGMQGNETDHILYSEVTTAFNRTFQSELDKAPHKLAPAFASAFDTILPDLMEPKFSLEWQMWLFAIVWSAACLALTVRGVVTMVQHQGIDQAVEVKGSEPKLLNCPHCGASYYANTLKRCPCCGSHFEEETEF